MMEAGTIVRVVIAASMLFATGCDLEAGERLGVWGRDAQEGLASGGDSPAVRSHVGVGERLADGQREASQIGNLPDIPIFRSPK